MSASGDFDSALAHMQALQAIMEPGGGAVDWQEQPARQVRAFLRSAAAVTWNLGICMEDMLSQPGNRR